MSQVVIDHTLALALARTYAPTLYQEYRDIKDFPMPFLFGPVEEARAALGEKLAKPTLYFSVRKDDVYYYLFYLIYHAFDWSSSGALWGLVKKLDSHRHDTESVTIRADLTTQRMDMITVSHFEFKYEANTNCKVTGEAENHALHPHSQRAPRGMFACIPGQMFSLVNLRLYSDAEWEQLRAGLAGQASMPDEQTDSKLKSGLQGRKSHKPGHLYNAPEKVFKLAQQKGFL